jgi:gliding motility-associated-like protein
MKTRGKKGYKLNSGAAPNLFENSAIYSNMNHEFRFFKFKLIDMRKIYFVIAALFCFGAVINAQVNVPGIKAYEYKSEGFSEATIKDILEKSRTNGTKDWELQKLSDHLYERLRKQNERLAAGVGSTNQTTLEKAGHDQVMAACNNIGFESGNYTGWTLQSGDVTGASLPCPSCITSAVGQGIANVVNSGSSLTFSPNLSGVANGAICTGGVDNCTGQSVVAPGGGTYSLLLNENTAGYKIQRIKQTFTVGATNNVFTYQYLAVLQDGGHLATEQPYFFSQVTDGSGNPIPCTVILQSASAAIAGWTPAPGCPGTNYKGWVTVTLDLTSYMGQNVTIEFTSSDCNAGGHYGYSYIDASCDQINANNAVTVCPPSTQLCGPSGFTTYSWTGPVTGNAMCLPGATAGAYTLVTTGQCPAPTRFYTVTVAPVPTLTVNSPTICAGASTTLNAAGGVSYTWSPATGLSGTSGASVTANPAATTTYTLTGANAGGCTSSVTLVVTVNPGLTLNANSPTTCPGNTVALTATGATTYTWSPGATLSATNGATVNAFPASTTVYTITGTTGTCTGTTTSTVTIGGFLSPTVNSPSYCPGGSAVLTAAGGTTYTWSPAGGLSGTSGASVTASPATTTTYTINAASGGCTGSVTAVVTVNPLPPVTATGNTICNGAGPVNITGGGAVTYTWDSGSTANPQSVNPAATTNYTVTGTDANGCVNTSTCTVNVIANPTVAVANTSICAGQTATLTANSNTTTFTWTGSNIVAPATGSVITANPAATSTYTVLASAGTCTATTTAVVTINPAINPTFTSPPVCQGQATMFTNTTAGVTSYTWAYGDGNGTSVIANPTETYSAAGSYVATFSVVNASGCTGLATNTVVVNPNPTVTATGNSICNGAGPVNVTGAGAATYTWNTGSSANPLSVNPAATTSYTVTGSTALGCTDTSVATVFVVPNPTITVANTSICAGQTATLTANSNATTFAWSGPNLVTTTGTVVTANPAAAAVYTVIGTVGTCTVTTTANVAINPNINPTFTSPPVCQGQATIFTNTTAGVTSYTWDYGDSNGSTVIPNPTETYSAAGSYVATFSVVNAAGCTGFVTNTVVVNPNPVPAFTSSSPCQGTAVSFTNTTPAAPAISTWAWNFGDGNTSPAQTPTNNYVAAGVYVTTLTATTTNGCTTTVTNTVAVHPNPVASFSNTTVCLNTPPTSFTDLSTLVNPAGINDNINTWAWAFGDGNTSLTQSPSNNYATCGTFNASLFVTTNNLCTSTFTLVVTVNCVPTITPPASPTVCPNTTVAPAAFVMSIPGSTATWNSLSQVTGVSAGGTGTVPAYTSMTPNYTGGNISDVVSAFPKSAAGCIGLPQTFTITVFPTPRVNTMPDVTVCDFQTVNVSAFTSTPVGSTYTWTNGNPAIGLAATGAGNIASFPGQTGGSPNQVAGTISVTPTLNGCVGPDSTFVITVTPQPTVTLTSPPLTCPGNTVPAPTYTMNPNDPATTFAWTNNNINTGMAPNGGPAVAGSFTAASNATLSNIVGVVTVIPTLGTCVGPPATYTVTIYPTPIINPVADVQYCPNVGTVPVNISMIPVNGGAQSYSWITPTGATIGLTPTTGTVNIVPSFTTINGGSTTVTSQVILSGGLDGCPALPITYNITVNPNPTALFGVSPKVCLGNPMAFTDHSSVGSGNIAQWGWDFNNDGIYTDATTQNPSFVFTAPAGSHTVGLQVTTNDGCRSDTTFPVYINFIPVPQFAGDILTGCPIHPVNFVENSTVVGPAQINNWSWNFGNGTTFISQTQGASAGTIMYDNLSHVANAYYSVSLQVTTDSGCIASITNTSYITVYPHPKADFSWGPTDADVDNPVIYFQDLSQGAAGPSATYGPNGMMWNLGDTHLANQAYNFVNTVKNPVHMYEYYEPETYTVTQWVENTHGCKDSISHPVDIKPTFSFYIPNAFSPNDDGVNEGFKGTGVGIDNSTYNLWVFDRWGMQIFYTNDIEKVWNGRMHGADGAVLQQDVYVWKVKFSDFKGGKHEYKGTVSLIK